MSEKLQYLWKLYPSPDKPIYAPKDNVSIHFNAENLLTNTYLYFSKLIIHPSWSSAPISWDTNLQLSPKSTSFLKYVSFQVPESVTGEQNLKLGLTTWFWKVNFKEWISLGDIFTNIDYRINITPSPVYKAFISRSNRNEDIPIVEPITEKIRSWGFETKTVGINVFAKGKKEVPSTIINEIISSDCLIAIATPRDQSAIDGFYKTFAWLQSEVSFAFVKKKPVIVFLDDRVKPQGLVANKYLPIFSFSIFNYPKLYNEINQVMLSLRKIIKRKKEEDFNKILTTIFKRIASAPEVFFLGYSSRKLEE